MSRALTLEQAQRLYVNRYTLEHVPTWARAPGPNGYYAPHYRSDAEWYENTTFPGEVGHLGGLDHCYSSNQTWPLGKRLESQYTIR